MGASVNRGRDGIRHRSLCIATGQDGGRVTRVCESQTSKERTCIVGVLRAKTGKQGEVSIQIKDHLFLGRVKHFVIINQGFPVAGSIVAIEVGDRGGVIIGPTLNLTGCSIPLIFLEFQSVSGSEPLPSFRSKTCHDKEQQIAGEGHNLGLVLFTIQSLDMRLVGGSNLID